MSAWRVWLILDMLRAVEGIRSRFKHLVASRLSCGKAKSAVASFEEK